MDVIPRVKQLTSEETSFYHQLKNDPRKTINFLEYFFRKSGRYQSENKKVMNVLLYYAVQNNNYPVLKVCAKKYKKILLSPNIYDSTKVRLLEYFLDSYSHVSFFDFKVEDLGLTDKKLIKKMLNCLPIQYYEKYFKNCVNCISLLKYIATHSTKNALKSAFVAYLKRLNSIENDFGKIRNLLDNNGIEHSLENYKEELKNRIGVSRKHLAEFISENYTSAAPLLPEILNYNYSDRHNKKFFSYFNEESLINLVHENPSILEKIPSEILTEGICYAAVSTAGTAIKNVPLHLMSDRVTQMAISKANTALKYIPAKKINKRAVLQKAIRDKSVLKYYRTPKKE